MIKSLLFGASLLTTAPCWALDLSTISAGPGKILVKLSGPIVAGDRDHLIAYIGQLPGSETVVGLSLDSPGGAILEAEDIAEGIHAAGYPVVVGQGATCASACFLLFAASPQRFAARNAQIGVHSASFEGERENILTMGMTTVMARDATAFGVPPSIIGRMVTTLPGDISWLSRAEETEMQVTFLDDERGAPSSMPEKDLTVLPAAAPDPLVQSQPDHDAQPAETAVLLRAPDPVPAQLGVDVGVTALPALNAPTPQTSAPASPLYSRGLADRRLWEAWYASLSGDYRDGATYWAGQRGLPQAGACQGIVAVHDDGQFTEGCRIARERLAHSDAMREIPDYRAGWNSLTP